MEGTGSITPLQRMLAELLLALRLIERRWRLAPSSMPDDNFHDT